MTAHYRQYLWFAAAIALTALISTAGLVLAKVETQHPTTRQATVVLPVEVTRIQPESGYTMERIFTGRVQAKRDSVLGFELAGRLADVKVDEGNRVTTGMLLAELDIDRLQSRRDELLAALAEAEANLALANATLKRMRGIVDQGGVSRQGLDEANEGQRAANAALQLAKQRIASIDVELDKSRLYAPFDGTVVARLADEGRVLDTGEPIIRIQEGTAPEIRVGVAGSAVRQLLPGQVYHLTWQGRDLQARLRAVLPLREATARTIDALFDPLESNPALLPGDIVTLALPSHIDQPGFWLPLTALTEGQRGLWSILIAEPSDQAPEVLTASHRIDRRTVDIVHQTADRVFVRGALGDNDLIVTTGLQRIVPNQWVRIKDESNG